MLIAKMVFRAKMELCDGCRMCELVCSLSKTGTVNPHLARIRVVRYGKGIKEDAPRPVICRHCKVARCEAVCPVPGAISLNEQTGVLVIDESRCNQCMACVEACPFGAIWVGPSKEILKCDLCDGDPLCVKYCPYRPDHSMAALPFPRQSCLQFVER
ncbi:4Fe-4S dicluster domain-containing protein [Chloroflexota bacterium]